MLPCSKGSYTQHTRALKAPASWLVVVPGLTPQVGAHDSAQVGSPVAAPYTLAPSRIRSDSTLSLSLRTFFFMADLLTWLGRAEPGSRSVRADDPPELSSAPRGDSVAGETISASESAARLVSEVATNSGLRQHQ